MIGEIQKYHDGRYKNVSVVYLCGEIGNPDKERAYVPIDRVLEIIDKAQTYKMAVGSTDLYIDREEFRNEVLALKGEQE